MKLRILLLALPPAALALAGDLGSSSRGIYFPSLTQTAPSCGSCHRASPGAAPGFPAIAVDLQPSARILARGQSIQFALAATGGQTASGKGGFAVDATAGTFSAGANTSVVPPGGAVTHANSSSRSWTFGYTAPQAAGLVEVYGVVNTVNDDQINGDEDMWAFHGADDTAVQVTPVRLFVNAASVAPLGTACAGSFGNVPVLGCPLPPARGSSGFRIEVHGAAPASVAALLLGVHTFTPGLDLGVIGVTGCSLFVDPLVTIFATTSQGDAGRGEGTVGFGVPIPGQPELLGATLHFQGLVVDTRNGRPVPLTMTNALSATIL
jgi:hypothetical protein